MNKHAWIKLWLDGAKFVPPPWWGPREYEAYYRMEFELHMREVRPVQELRRRTGQLPYVWSFTEPLKYVGTSYEGCEVVFLDWMPRYDVDGDFEPVFGINFGDGKYERIGQTHLKNELYAFYINGLMKEYMYVVEKLTEDSAVKYDINRDWLFKYLATKELFDHHSITYNASEMVCDLWEEVGEEKPFDYVAQALGCFTPPPESEIVPWLMKRDTYLEELRNAEVEDDDGRTVRILTENEK